MSRILSSAIVTGLHLRSYDAVHWGDRHAFAQLVLPVDGAVLLDIDNRRGTLDPLHAALVAPGAWHAQSSRVSNASLIVDVEARAFADGPWAELLDQPFTPIGAAARKLVEFMAVLARAGEVPDSIVQGWTPLLLDTLTQGAPRPASRLGAVLAQIEAQPGLPWTTATMARAANLSVSRLHALFNEHHGSTPGEYLLARRLEHACALLAGTARSVSDIALASGFSDQTSLTRAMRRTLDTTPAAYRRAIRENGSSSQ
ncbi:AraC family transcriptional regulator [Massilia aurea]|uniref:AraC family transcriptional regulator n=1 Tax=Massilia aurea TaxID=373040 RepID=UPI003461E50B